MSRGTLPLVLVVLACVVAGCSSSHGVEDDDAPSAGEKGMSSRGDKSAESEGKRLTYFEDVKPIIDAKCTQCHVDGGIGPLPLTTFEEVKLVKELVALDVSEGKMPPWRANAALDYYVGERRLTQKQKDTIVRWVKQGAHEGDPGDEPEPPPTSKRGLSRIDGTMMFEKPFKPSGKEIDEYRCVPMKWPYQETKYITGMSVEPEQRAMVHHGVVYFVQPENAETVLKRDAETEELGYPCNGVNVGNAAWLTSYEPGGYGQDVPGGLGFEVRPGSVFVLQMHYNTLNGVEPDQSRIDFKVEDRVDRVGRVQLIMNPAWPAGYMRIPAGASDVTHAAVTRPQIPANGALSVYWVDLHMHTLGSSGSIGIMRANGTRQGLLDIPDWAFAWQETYILKEPVKLEMGDTFYVECHFDNSEEHQAPIDGQKPQPRDVNWGENTTDEMCLGNVLVGPPE
jgi:hypothetical protein